MKFVQAMHVPNAVSYCTAYKRQASEQECIVKLTASVFLVTDTEPLRYQFSDHNIICLRIYQ